MYDFEYHASVIWKTSQMLIHFILQYQKKFISPVRKVYKCRVVVDSIVDLDIRVFKKPKFCKTAWLIILSVVFLENRPILPMKYLPNSHPWMTVVCVLCFPVKGGVSWEHLCLLPVASRCSSWLRHQLEQQDFSVLLSFAQNVKMCALKGGGVIKLFLLLIKDIKCYHLFIYLFMFTCSRFVQLLPVWCHCLALH